MFRFTDQEDRVGVGVYDVILEPGEKDAQLKTENRVVQNFGGYRSLRLPSIRQSGTTRKFLLESRMIGGNYLVRFGG